MVSVHDPNLSDIDDGVPSHASSKREEHVWAYQPLLILLSCVETTKTMDLCHEHIVIMNDEMVAGTPNEVLQP